MNYNVPIGTKYKATMNLYFRLIWALLRAWRKPAIAPGDTISREMRVWPNNLDVNGHMNNGRYLTVVDLMLIEYFIRMGFFRAMLKNGWRPMSGGTFVTYRRGLQPLQRYELRFAHKGCDTHWNYLRFEFWSGDKLCAAGYFKGAIVGKKGLVPNEESFIAMNIVAPMHTPEPVRHWLGAEAELMAEVR